MNKLLVSLLIGALLSLVGWTAHAELARSTVASTTTPAPQIWEYDILESYKSQVVTKLNERGAQGWELTTTACPRPNDLCLHYLKRPLTRP